MNFCGSLFTFIREGWRCDRFRYPLNPERGDKDTHLTGKMAAARAYETPKWSRLLRSVPELDHARVAEIAGELTNTPKNSLVKGHKFFADAFIHDVEGKLTLVDVDGGETPSLLYLSVTSSRGQRDEIVNDGGMNWFVIYGFCLLHVFCDQNTFVSRFDIPWVAIELSLPWSVNPLNCVEVGIFSHPPMNGHCDCIFAVISDTVNNEL